MTDDDSGTTESDYRWRWLSTIWALVYGIGFPTVLFARGVDVAAPVMGTLLLGWGATVVYIIGPENVEAWQELRGK